MKFLLIFFSVIFIISSVAPLVKREEWWIRGFDFPYVQFSVLGAGCVLIWFVFFFPASLLEWIICISTASLLIHRLTVIYPYTKLKRPILPWGSEDKEGMSILSANVLMTNGNYGDFLKLIDKDDPDILLLVEVDENWERAIEKDLNAKYKFKVLQPLNNTYGMMLYSKLEIFDSSVKYLIEEGVPSIFTKVRISDDTIAQLYCLHPKPPAPGENDTSVPRDAELVMVGKMAKKSDLPIIVAGDMNDVAWSHTTRLFMRISGLLDPRIGRGFYNTFHASRPLLRWPLDHIFLSHHFRIVKLQRLDNFNSDHFPISIEVSLNSSIHAKASREFADKEDIDEAKEKLEKVRG